jgi:hypothetical protein
MVTNFTRQECPTEARIFVYLLHHPSTMKIIPFVLLACLLIIYYCTTPPKRKSRPPRSSTEELVPPVFSVHEFHELHRPHNVGSCGFCIIKSVYEAVKPSDYTPDMWPSNQVNRIDGSARLLYVLLRTLLVRLPQCLNPLVRGHVLVCPIKHSRQRGLQRSAELDSRSMAEGSSP